MSKILICPNCQTEHQLFLEKIAWFVCNECQKLLKLMNKEWLNQGATRGVSSQSGTVFLGQEGLLRNRHFKVVGCVQFCLAEDEEDIWFEWILAFDDGSCVFLIEAEDEPLRFFAQRRPISHTVPEFSDVQLGKSIKIENFYIDVFERYRSLVVSFAGEIPIHQPPGSPENYFDGYYGKYIAAITYEDVPMICFGIELGTDELTLSEP